MEASQHRHPQQLPSQLLGPPHNMAGPQNQPNSPANKLIGYAQSADVAHLKPNTDSSESKIHQNFRSFGNEGGLSTQERMNRNQPPQKQREDSYNSHRQDKPKMEVSKKREMYASTNKDVRKATPHEIRPSNIVPNVEARERHDQQRAMQQKQQAIQPQQHLRKKKNMIDDDDFEMQPVEARQSMGSRDSKHYTPSKDQRYSHGSRDQPRDGYRPHEQPRRHTSQSDEKRVKPVHQHEPKPFVPAGAERQVNPYTPQKSPVASRDETRFDRTKHQDSQKLDRSKHKRSDKLPEQKHAHRPLSPTHSIKSSKTQKNIYQKRQRSISKDSASSRGAKSNIAAEKTSQHKHGSRADSRKESHTKKSRKSKGSPRSRHSKKQSLKDRSENASAIRGPTISHKEKQKIMYEQYLKKKEGKSLNTTRPSNISPRPTHNVEIHQNTSAKPYIPSGQSNLDRDRSVLKDNMSHKEKQVTPQKGPAQLPRTLNQPKPYVPPTEHRNPKPFVPKDQLEQAKPKVAEKGAFRSSDSGPFGKVNSPSMTPFNLDDMPDIPKKVDPVVQKEPKPFEPSKQDKHDSQTKPKPPHTGGKGPSDSYDAMKSHYDETRKRKASYNKDRYHEQSGDKNKQAKRSENHQEIDKNRTHSKHQSRESDHYPSKSDSRNVNQQHMPDHSIKHKRESKHHMSSPSISPEKRAEAHKPQPFVPKSAAVSSPPVSLKQVEFKPSEMKDKINITPTPSFPQESPILKNMESASGSKNKLDSLEDSVFKISSEKSVGDKPKQALPRADSDFLPKVLSDSIGSNNDDVMDIALPIPDGSDNIDELFDDNGANDTNQNIQQPEQVLEENESEEDEGLGFGLYQAYLSQNIPQETAKQPEQQDQPPSQQNNDVKMQNEESSDEEIKIQVPETIKASNSSPNKSAEVHHQDEPKQVEETPQIVRIEPEQVQPSHTPPPVEKDDDSESDLFGDEENEVGEPQNIPQSNQIVESKIAVETLIRAENPEKLMPQEMSKIMPQAIPEPPPSDSNSDSDDLEFVGLPENDHQLNLIPDMESNSRNDEEDQRIVLPLQSSQLEETPEKPVQKEHIEDRKSANSKSESNAKVDPSPVHLQSVDSKVRDYEEKVKNDDPSAIEISPDYKEPDHLSDANKMPNKAINESMFRRTSKASVKDTGKPATTKMGKIRNQHTLDSPMHPNLNRNETASLNQESMRSNQHVNSNPLDSESDISGGSDFDNIILDQVDMQVKSGEEVHDAQNENDEGAIAGLWTQYQHSQKAQNQESQDVPMQTNNENEIGSLFDDGSGEDFGGTMMDHDGDDLSRL